MDFEKLLQKVTKTLYICKMEYDDNFKKEHVHVLEYLAFGMENRDEVELTEEEYNYLKRFEVEGKW